MRNYFGVHSDAAERQIEFIAESLLSGDFEFNGEEFGRMVELVALTDDPASYTGRGWEDRVRDACDAVTETYVRKLESASRSVKSMLEDEPMPLWERELLGMESPKFRRERHDSGDWGVLYAVIGEDFAISTNVRNGMWDTLSEHVFTDTDAGECDCEFSPTGRCYVRFSKLEAEDLTAAVKSGEDALWAFLEGFASSI